MLLKHLAPEQFKVLMLLSEALDDPVWIGNPFDPAGKNHVLEQRSGQHYGLTSIALARQTYRRSERLGRSGKDRPKLNASAILHAPLVRVNTRPLKRSIQILLGRKMVHDLGQITDGDEAESNAHGPRRGTQ